MVVTAPTDNQGGTSVERVTDLTSIIHRPLPSAGQEGLLRSSRHQGPLRRPSASDTRSPLNTCSRTRAGGFYQPIAVGGLKSNGRPSCPSAWRAVTRPSFVAELLS